MPHLEFHQLDHRLEHLRVRHPSRFRRLIASLAESGQQTPIVVVQPEASSYLIIDGHQRVAALKQLGRDTVEAVVWEMKEAEALLLWRALRSQPPETALEQGWLLQEMESRQNCSMEELARRLDRSAGWVARRLSLVETLPESVQQRVREGKIAAQVAARYLAPVARVSREQCERLAAAMAERNWSNRQIASLCAAWRGARSAAARERIVASPELFLKAREQQLQNGNEPPEAGTLESDLNKIAAIARRALQRSEWETPPPESVNIIQAKLRHTVQMLEQLASRIEQQGHQQSSHDEPGTTRNDSGVERPRSEPPGDRAPAESLAAERAQGAAIQLQPDSANRARRESSGLPPTDSRTPSGLQGQPGASP